MCTGVADPHSLVTGLGTRGTCQPRPVTPSDDIRRRPLTSREASRAGLGRRELESPRWQQPRRGVHLWHELEPTDPDVRIAAAVTGRPEAVLGGWASLRVQGVRRLDGRTGPGAALLQPVLLHVGPTGRTRPTAALDVDRGRLDLSDVREVAGLQVTGPAHACLAVACRYGAEEGLVAADAAVRTGLTCPEELAERVGAMGRARGVPHARLVSELVDGRARSAPESRLRYVWIVGAGLPRPQVNPLVLTSDGRVVAATDLLDVEAAMVGEYDGAHHRDLRQHADDNEREEGPERLNLVVVRATAVDLWPRRRRLVARLQDGRRDGMGRNRARDRWGWQPGRS